MLLHRALHRLCNAIANKAVRHQYAPERDVEDTYQSLPIIRKEEEVESLPTSFTIVVPPRPALRCIAGRSVREEEEDSR